jgi:chromate reductase
MADETLKVISICGSLRKGSYNRMVMNALQNLAPAGMSIREAPPFSEFPLYNADLETSTGIPAAVQKLADAVRAADGVVFNTPEYNFSIPGGLKNAIDWVSRVQNQPFAGKPVAIQSATHGVLGGGRMQYDLRRSMIFLNALTLNKPEIFIGNCEQRIDAKPGRSPTSRRLNSSGSSLPPLPRSSSGTAASASPLPTLPRLRGREGRGRGLCAISAAGRLHYIRCSRVPLIVPWRTPWWSRPRRSRATASPTRNTISRRSGKPIMPASPSTT